MTVVRFGSPANDEGSSPLETRSRGGHDGGMDDGERLTALETHFGYIRKDLDEIKAGQQAARVDDRKMRFTIFGTFVAIVTVILASAAIIFAQIQLDKAYQANLLAAFQVRLGLSQTPDATPPKKP